MSDIQEFSDKKLIVGLGNPGRKYANTRHNVGWRVLDELSRRHHLSFDTKERKAITAAGHIGKQKAILAKPQTYMNLSGEAVRALMDFYRINLDHLIVIHDDIDLPLGQLRIRKTGGHGGHNGMRNIMLHLGARDFNRIRFGVNRPPGKMDAQSFVLMPFAGDDEILAREVVERSADAVESWLAEGIDVAMTRYNGDLQQEEKSRKTPGEELTLYQRAHELNPKDPAPLEKMIAVLRRLNRIDDAAYTHLKLANLYMEQDQPQLVVKNWERAVDFKPGWVDVQLRIAQAYEQLEDSKRAVNRYLKLAEYYETQENTDQAIKALEDALRLNPQHPKALSQIRELQNSQNSLEEG